MATAAAVAQTAPSNIIANADFEAQPPVEGGVPNWTIVGDMSLAGVAEENGNHFVRLQLPSQGYMQVTQQHPVGADWTGLKISAKVRIQNLKQGPESHNTVTLLYTFNDANGKHVGPWLQKMFSADQNWTPFEVTLDEIPQGAVTLTVACSIMNASAIADFDDVTVTAVTR